MISYVKMHHSRRGEKEIYTSRLINVVQIEFVLENADNAAHRSEYVAFLDPQQTLQLLNDFD